MKCEACEQKGMSFKVEGTNLCASCRKKAVEIATAERTSGKKVAMTGIVRSMWKERFNAKLLTVHDIPGELIDGLHDIAGKEEVTFREAVIASFKLLIKQGEIK